MPLASVVAKYYNFKGGNEDTAFLVLNKKDDKTSDEIIKIVTEFVNEWPKLKEWKDWSGNSFLSVFAKDMKYDKNKKYKIVKLVDREL